MYVRLVRFALGPGKRDVAEGLAKELHPLIVSQAGCESAVLFGDDDAGEYGIVVLWDSAEHANAAAQVVRPQLEKHLSGHAKAPPDARLFEVIAR